MTNLQEDNACRFDLPLVVTEPGLYRRPLPDTLISFSSSLGRTLFQEALAEGHLNNYFPLVEQFTTQADPAFCGLSSLVMVLNALEIDPGRVWKGSWRWYNEQLTDCCNQIPNIKERGISLPQLSGIARCNGLQVKSFFQRELTLEAFREQVINISSTNFGRHMLLSYDRKLMDQTGSGHISPLGGYHAGRDLVLVLDVARFKYPPHWVPLAQLWQAMASIDPSTEDTRGHLICEILGAE